MSSTNYAVLLALGLLDEDKKAPNGEGTQEKINTKNDNINPPSDGETGG